MHPLRSCAEIRRRLPWILFVPDLVTIFTTPPVAFPYAALILFSFYVEFLQGVRVRKG